MDEIVQMVSKKFNIPPETAQQIVTFIAEQVKGKLPEGLSSHIDALMGTASGAGQGASSEGLMDTVKNLAGGLLNKS